MRRIGAANATHVAPAADVAVAIIDSGIDLKHPDLTVVAGYNAIDPEKPAHVSVCEVKCKPGTGNQMHSRSLAGGPGRARRLHADITCGKSNVETGAITLNGLIT